MKKDRTCLHHISYIDSNSAESHFARCLLMPREAFVREYEKAKGLLGIDEVESPTDMQVIALMLARKFRVPTEDAKIRIQEIFGNDEN